MYVSMYLQSQLVSNVLYFYKSLEMLFSAKVIEHMYVLRTRIVNTFFSLFVVNISETHALVLLFYNKRFVIPLIRLHITIGT
jgi:hypothetical protein